MAGLSPAACGDGVTAARGMAAGMGKERTNPISKEAAPGMKSVLFA
jgi:hypothetical protein